MKTWTPGPGRLLLIEGKNSFILAGQADSPFTLYIESLEGEVCQSVAPQDLVVVSSPEGGPLEPARMLLELVRRYASPLVVLPRDHPGSRRLSRVVVVSPRVYTSCVIRRGTHPEQHLVCSSEELAGIEMSGKKDGIEVRGLPESIRVSILD